jgi:peptidyl-prolyl cis-trans isomerase SurA
MRLFALFTFCLLLAGTSLAQQRQVADQIVAVVNDNVILKSDVDQQLTELMRVNQIQQFDEQFWFYVLEEIINNYVMIEKQRIDSVVVSDAEVARQRNEQIEDWIQRVGSEQALEQAFGQPLIEIRDQLTDRIHDSMLRDRVQFTMLRRVTITRPEVKAFFECISVDDLPIIPTKHRGHKPSKNPRLRGGYISF